VTSGDHPRKSARATARFATGVMSTERPNAKLSSSIAASLAISGMSGSEAGRRRHGAPKGKG